VSATATTWLEANQRHLAAEAAVVRERLRALVGEECDLDAALAERDAAANDAPTPPALATIGAALGLTSFERDVVAAAAACELDGEVARLCAAAQGDPRRTQLTFALAQTAFEAPHWSALTPARPLRALRIVELGPGSLLSSPLALSERVLHHLFGIDQPDERLLPWLVALPPAGDVPPELEPAVGRIASLWTDAFPPLLQVVGSSAGDRRLVVAAAAAAAGRAPLAVAAAELPTDPVERDGWWRLVQRELLLDGLALVVDVPPDPSPATVETLTRLELLAGAVVLSAPAARPLTAVTVPVPRLSRAEQRRTWKRALGEEADVERVARSFDLGAADIARAAATARAGDDIWEACRRETRPALDGLAQRVRSRAGWDDLVLPDIELDAVRTIAAHAPHRLDVADDFAASPRGQGLVALFSGPSGCGKTLAAEVIANELRLDLFRVDLSTVVSKWIGETEKHLRTILDEADRGSAVLLFDEADALFGKRSEVRDSHDRFANIEVGYLLQRLETFRGIAVLTTNMRSSLDAAFTRRIRYVVQFPYPDATLRERIWRRAFPPSAELIGVDFARLAHLELSGGSIHNIAVHATLDAAAARSPIAVDHVRRGVVREYAKLDRPLTHAEAEGLR